MISSTPLRVHRRWQVLKKNQHGCQSDSATGEGQVIFVVVIVTAPPVLALASMRRKLPSHPKSHYIILSSCVYPYSSLKELWRTVCSRVSFLCCQNVSAGDQLILEIGRDTEQRFVFIFLWFSLWSNMNGLSVAMRGPIFRKYGQVSSFRVVYVCACVLPCVNAVTRFQSWVNVLGMVLSHEKQTNSCVMTSTFPSADAAVKISMVAMQAGYWDCRFLFFFCQHGQGVVYPLFMSTLVIQRKAI